MSKRPYFSIIIPMFNREREIGRAVNSCLAQDFEDFEIIVVDDGSTDGSVAVVQNFTDPRIKLICHEVNRGVSPARNTGVDAASGEWVIFLDSDDELLPGALATMRRRTSDVGNEIKSVRFMCRLDSGELSPAPPLKDEVWNYEAYIRWTESTLDGRQETLGVVRRKTFQKVRYPDNRSLEAIYHLDFARHFLARSCPDVMRLYHQDADNQLVKPEACRALVSAPDQARGMEAILSRHGEALWTWAPKRYWQHVSGLATLHFLSGHRVKALHYAARCLRSKPLSVRTWAIVVFGLLGRRSLAWLKVSRSRWPQARRSNK